jgi:hypothetical protein
VQTLETGFRWNKRNFGTNSTMITNRIYSFVDFISFWLFGQLESRRGRHCHRGLILLYDYSPSSCKTPTPI